jgi:predicted homoserine dehydrogenase-like protein
MAPVLQDLSIMVVGIATISDLVIDAVKSAAKLATNSDGKVIEGSDASKTVTDTYQILITDEIVVCNKSSAFTVTLPTGVVGKQITVKNIGAGVVTIEGAGSDTVDGDANQTLIQWESAQLQYYAANAWGVL